ncbi:site-specific integrase [Apilactobacillus micheneri]|uniref:Site-specific integrase n=1 Tax=Apilactobacillus micheneri TaxID=1899430 RepID=A0A9Q8IL85_9LACO|nr:site-specific integrase [Apilactobacillus micheneri]TPR37597.1 site-specific integrase [Apilactobacillus micheneri]TPR38728.1 site-specific integrase [Apilactobacillus micheneri]TPR42396.1 site-specific integrase [Apilactobacillus micheneri]TPR43404.1 site-specific integrase [Apilactobacillus micheneri]
MKQTVYPIKDSNVLSEVQDTLLHNFRWGRRNLTIFQVGKATLLRVSDVLALQYSDVFDEQGHIKSHAYIHDQKTGKPNNLYLQPVEKDLMQYQQWLVDNHIHSKWLFPSSENDKHIDGRQFYRIMQKVGDLLNINYLGTHTMRKTGAYRVYVQSNYNIGLVMNLLNHSSQSMTLRYLGLDRESTEKILNNIDFG